MKKNLLFVRAKSRLGLIHPPNGETNPNVGVETGPDAVLSEAFVKQFSNFNVITFQFSPPENVESIEYLEMLAREYQQLITRIHTQFDNTKTVVTVGGDHSVSLGSISAVLQTFDPQKTGIIMIDSHGDIHQPSTSPSGNFHGMWLSPIIDTFELEKIDQLVLQKVPPQQLMYIGNLDIEEAEKKFIAEKNVHTFSKSELNSSAFTAMLDQFIHTLEHIHVSIDIDAFSHAFAPATGMMIKDGLTPNNVFPILEKLKHVKSLSVDLVEVNPTKDGAEKTVKLAQELLLVMLS